MFLPAPHFNPATGVAVVDYKQGSVTAGGAASINLPANRADTLCVAWLGGATSTTADAPTITGWSSIESENAPATDYPRFRLMYKYGPGTTAILDPNTSFFNAAYIIWSIVRCTGSISGTDSTKAHDDLPVAVPNSPSITTLVDNSLVLSCGVMIDTTTATGWSAPSGYSGLVVQSGNDSIGQNAVVMGAWKMVSTPGAEDPGAFSHSTELAGWGAATLRIAPA